MSNNSKRKKIDRQSLYVTLVVILMMAAVIVAIGVSLAKSKSIIEKTLETARTHKNEASSPEGDERVDYDYYDTENVFVDDEETEPVIGEDEKETQPVEAVPEQPTTDEIEGVSGELSSALPEFCAPVGGEITKACSLETPVFSQTMEDFRTHPGVDLYCPVGTDVLCVADGAVLEVWDDPLMGMSIFVEHSGGAVSVYKGLSDTVPEGIVAGAQVKRGQVIASSGDTALIEIAQDSHLHLELMVNGERVDPCDYIDFSSEISYEG